MFAELNQLENFSIQQKDKHKIAKVLILCFLSSFFGHHTLKELLTAYDVKSTRLYNIYNKLSYNDLSKISLQLFKHYITEELKELGHQSESSWSRACPTFVIDASVYKQWLSNHECKFFDKFFSGQTHKPEYGFRLTLGGIAIDDTFYPLLFTILPKHITDGETASSLLIQMQSVVNQITNEHQLKFGKWYLSVDNGYSDNILLDTCAKLEIIPICVPKNSHLFIIDGMQVKLSKLVEDEFIVNEIEHNKIHPEFTFTMRIKAYYKSLGREITLLIFRYKDSKKVSVIYSTSADIKGKTLRHHWFQRTYIEQFFRFSKHTLKAAQSTADNVEDFIRKICLNFMKTIFSLTVRNHFRKNHRYFKNWTFGKISLFVSTHRVGEQWLIEMLDLKDVF